MDLRLPPSLLGISKRNFRFVFQASRCLIYKVQKFFCSPLFRECLFILPDSVSFVKLFFNFFRSFSRFESLNSNFSKLFVRFRWPTGQLIYNTTSASPCQQVFSSFVNFIRKRFKKPVRRRACGGPPFRTALLGYHHILPKSTLFSSFSANFSCAGRSSPPAHDFYNCISLRCS